MSFVVPKQDTYLTPFCEDTPSDLGKWLRIYNLFVRVGDDEVEGKNSTRFDTLSDISGEMPNISARVYDYSGVELDATWSISSPNLISVNSGQVVVNNCLIELGDFTSNFNESDGHWSTGNIYGTWTIPNSSTMNIFMCVLFNPYNDDGTVNSTEPLAKIVYVRNDEIDYSIMAPIWLLRVTKTGSSVSNVSILLEHSSSTVKIEQIGLWKNYLIDGGDLD